MIHDATYIINKYRIQIEHMPFEWNKFLLTPEKDFPDILKEIFSSKNNQKHQPISNINNSTPNKNRSQYTAVIANRTRTLTLATSTNEACEYEHILHSTSENNTYGGNYHASNHTYQGWHNNQHKYNTAPFWSLCSNHDQWGFHYRGSTRQGNWSHYTK